MFSPSEDPVPAVFSSGQSRLQQFNGTSQSAKHMAYSPIIHSYEHSWMEALPMILLASAVNGSLSVSLSPIFRLPMESTTKGNPPPPIVKFRNPIHTSSKNEGNSYAEWSSLITVTCAPIPLDDPTLPPLKVKGSMLSLLFVDFLTRNRYRINGRIHSEMKEIQEGTAVTFQVETTNSYSFCPKYVQRRKAVHSEISKEGDTENSTKIPKSSMPSTVLSSHSSSPLSPLPPFLVDWILSTPDFFISSVDPKHNTEAGYRGGRPGFLRLWNPPEGHGNSNGGPLLIWPDYRGNPFFTVLGNTLNNPSAMILLVDFHLNATIQITGDVFPLFTYPKDGGKEFSVRTSPIDLDTPPPKGEDLDGADRHIAMKVKKWSFHPFRPAFGCPLGNSEGTKIFSEWKFRHLDASSHCPPLKDRPIQSLIPMDWVSGLTTEEAESALLTKLKSESENEESQKKKIRLNQAVSSASISPPPSSSPSSLFPLLVRCSSISCEDFVDDEGQSGILSFEFQAENKEGVEGGERAERPFRWKAGQFVTLEFDVSKRFLSALERQKKKIEKGEYDALLEWTGEDEGKDVSGGETTVIRRSYTISKPTNSDKSHYSLVKLKERGEGEGEEKKSALSNEFIEILPSDVLSPSLYYSSSSFVITVKRVKGGEISQWLHQNVFDGTIDKIKARVLGMEGTFTLSDMPANRIPPKNNKGNSPEIVSLLWASGGVGITPFIAFSQYIWDFVSQMSVSPSLSPFVSSSPPLLLKIHWVHSECHMANVPFSRHIANFNDFARKTLLTTSTPFAISFSFGLFIPSKSRLSPLQLTPRQSLSHIAPRFMEILRSAPQGNNRWIFGDQRIGRDTLKTIKKVLIGDNEEMEKITSALCGPPAFLQGVSKALGEEGFTQKNIRMEDFSF